MHRRISRYYPGTGDLFASVMLAALLNGDKLADACEFAGEFVKDCNRLYGRRSRPIPCTGVQFEKLLPRLIDGTYKQALREPPAPGDAGPRENSKEHRLWAVLFAAVVSRRAAETAVAYRETRKPAIEAGFREGSGTTGARGSEERSACERKRAAAASGRVHFLGGFAAQK